MKVECYWCGVITDSPHKDHFLPRTFGGKTNDVNLVDACPHCNISKGNRFWVKTPSGVEKYRSPETYISQEEDLRMRYVVVTTVFAMKKTKRGRVGSSRFSGETTAHEWVKQHRCTYSAPSQRASNLSI